MLLQRILLLSAQMGRTFLVAPAVLMLAPLAESPGPYFQQSLGV
jgi:hypothetical protein